MCICGNPSMVLARREIRHSGILVARNLSFWNSGAQKSVILEFWWREIFRYPHVYTYVYVCAYVVIRPWFLHGETSAIREFWRPEIRQSGILAARNLPFGNYGGQKSFIRDFWRPEICHSGRLVARNPSLSRELMSIFFFEYLLKA